MIKMYATDQRGDGMVELIGEYDSWETVRVRCSMFSPEVVITFEETHESVEEDN